MVRLGNRPLQIELLTGDCLARMFITKILFSLIAADLLCNRAIIYPSGSFTGFALFSVLFFLFASW